MKELEIVKNVIEKNLESLDENVRRQIDFNVITLNWREIVGEYAEEIFPVEMIGTTLILSSENSSLKDNFKYRTPNLIKKINEHFNKEIVTKIIFGRDFKRKNIAEKISAREKFSTDEKNFDDVEISLTDEEIEECRKKAAVIADDERRQNLFDCLIAKKKSDALKKISRWHKCAICENLCAPQENLCDVCKINERNKMLQSIRQIFHDTPYIKFFDVQEKIFADMPHMKAECTLTLIESARMSLIQQTVRRISFNDKTSPLVKFFVMLVRQLPEESLTEKIIDKTLREFRFDFVDQPPLKLQNFKKFSSK